MGRKADILRRAYVFVRWDFCEDKQLEKGAGKSLPASCKTGEKDEATMNEGDFC
jgi:hypothetical protein